MLTACILVEHFPYRIETDQLPHLRGRRVLISIAHGPKRVVLDASPGLKGVTAGMPLQEAQSRYPDAVLCEANMALYRRRHEAMLDALEQFTPVVESGELGCAYVGLDGLKAMYGGSAALLQALQKAVPSDLESRFGIGPGKFPATIAALSAKDHQVTVVLDDLAAFLAPHPVDVLPVPWELLEQLKRLGLAKLGDIARQQIGPMQAHFGKEGRTIWEMAQGIDRRPLVPRRSEPHVSATNIFHNPTVALDVILLAIEHLLKRLLQQSEISGRYVRTILLDMRLSHRGPWHRRITFKEPVGSASVALQRIKHALSLVPPPGAVEEITLTFNGVTGESGRQASLFQEVRKKEQLRLELAQLEARLGVRPPIFQVRNAEPCSRIPERRQVLVEYAP
ncbi:MAG TPA: hypothetical protein VJM51_01525 [Dehalococcoidia bacterium]|nr:hypothetical protein [Dehalococcoidia bacterium]